MTFEPDVQVLDRKSDLFCKQDILNPIFRSSGVRLVDVMNVLVGDGLRDHVAVTRSNLKNIKFVFYLIQTLFTELVKKEGLKSSRTWLLLVN